MSQHFEVDVVSEKKIRPFARVMARIVPQEELDRLGIEEGMSRSHITTTPEVGEWGG
ncbi:MAG TPA: hypothetical protein VJP80_01260 [Candidatus Saccharimonadales bacterium]|nr:hypothetical protein [Candidatus Saccharimonadales bacterium]